MNLMLLSSVSSVVTGQWILVLGICRMNDVVAISLLCEKYYFVFIKTNCLVEVTLLVYLKQL